VVVLGEGLFLMSEVHSFYTYIKSFYTYINQRETYPAALVEHCPCSHAFFNTSSCCSCNAWTKPKGSYLRFIDSCITQLKAQGPSRTRNESKEEEEKTMCAFTPRIPLCSPSCTDLST